MKEVSRNLVFLLQCERMVPSLPFLSFLHINVIYEFFLVGKLIFSGFRSRQLLRELRYGNRCGHVKRSNFFNAALVPALLSLLLSPQLLTDGSADAPQLEPQPPHLLQMAMNNAA